MQPRTAFSIYGIENLFGGDFRRVIDVVRRADELGVDQMVMTDHVVMGERTDRYPYGKFPVPTDYPWYEPLVSLSAFAAVTQRIRLSMGVLIAPLRPAVLLAKQAATLDVISNGRLDLGVGTGWQREEFQASGIPYAKRGERLAEQMRVCRALWRGGRTSFRGPNLSFDDITCHPRPVQPDGVPLWFGLAPTDANCALVAELGAGWVPISQDPALIQDGAAKYRAAFERAGRDPKELQVRAHLPPKTSSSGAFDLEETLAAGVGPAVEAGATCIDLVTVLYCREPRDLDRALERIARIRL
jgi:probable F420-dependent oxidoreductase